MGISVEQWRCSIGLFNIKFVCMKFRNVEQNFSLIQLSFNLLCHFLSSMPVKIFLGLCTVFAYCSMVVTFLTLFLFLYPFLHLFSYPCPYSNYFIYLFVKITLLPWCISASFRSLYSFCTSQSSVKKHNVLHFCDSNSFDYIWISWN